MPLDFRPFVVINPNEETRSQKSLDRLGNTFGDIGSQALQYRQQQIQNARQQQMLDIQKAQEARAARGDQPINDFIGNYSSQNGQTMNVGPQGPMPSGGVEQGLSSGSQPGMGWNPPSQPNYQDTSGMSMNVGPQGPSQTNSMRHPDGTPFYQPSQNQSQNPIARAQNPMQGGFDWNTYANLPGSQASRYAEGAKVASEFPGGMNSKFLNPDQTNDVMTGQFNPKNWPGGYVPSSEVSAAAMNKRFGSSQSTKSEEYDRTEGTKIGTELNALTTSGRSALGIAAKAKNSLDQYRALLADPKATNEELNGVVQGINGLLREGGAVADYRTAAGKWNSIMTYLTSNPQQINTPEIKQQIMRNIDTLSNVSNSVINRNSRTVQAAHQGWIRKYPDQWSNMLSTINADTGAGGGGGGGNAQQGGTPDGTIKQIGTKSYVKRGGQWFPQ